MVCYVFGVKHVQHAHPHAHGLHHRDQILHCDVFRFDDSYYAYHQNENRDEILQLLKPLLHQGSSVIHCKNRTIPANLKLLRIMKKS